MSEDIIRIDGVEYEMCPNAAHCTSCPEGMINPCMTPKRKQTGWICKRCAPDSCIANYAPEGRVIPTKCVCDGEPTEWQPFNGEVVE